MVQILEALLKMFLPEVDTYIDIPICFRMINDTISQLEGSVHLTVLSNNKNKDISNLAREVLDKIKDTDTDLNSQNNEDFNENDLELGELRSGIQGGQPDQIFRPYSNMSAGAKSTVIKKFII